MTRDKHAKGPERVARAPVVPEVLPGSGVFVTGGARVGRAPTVHRPDDVAPHESAEDRHGKKK
jgi:hypothetical protein